MDQVTNSFKYQITFDPMYCSCSWFLDVGNCRHYVAACLLTDREKTDEEREFVMVRSRGRPPNSQKQLKFTNKNSN